MATSTEQPAVMMPIPIPVKEFERLAISKVKKRSASPMLEVLQDTATGQTYRVQRALGAGHTSDVYLVNGTFGKVTGPMACKAINRKPRFTWVYDSLNFKELVLLGLSSHINIVRFIGHFVTQTHFYILMEYCSNGSLADLVNRRGNTLIEPELRYLVKPVIDAICHIHGHSIVHRDLKPGNILLTEDFQVKICDFGCAVPTKSIGCRLVDGRLGSPNFISPEALFGHIKFYDGKASDIWGIGAIMYMLAYGRPPFQEGSSIDLTLSNVQKALYSFPPNTVKRVSGGLKKLVKEILVLDPTKRPNAHELWMSPYFKHAFTPKTLTRAVFSKAENYDEQIVEFKQRKELEMLARMRQRRRLVGYPVQAGGDLVELKSQNGPENS